MFPIPSCLSTESLAKCGIIYYTVRPFVAILPAWWRFAQCVRGYINTREGFPHLVNAGKYSTCFFVVIFSTVAAALKGDRKRERERGGEGEKGGGREGEREREREWFLKCNFALKFICHSLSFLDVSFGTFSVLKMST